MTNNYKKLKRNELYLLYVVIQWLVNQEYFDIEDGEVCLDYHSIVLKYEGLSIIIGRSMSPAMACLCPIDSIQFIHYGFGEQMVSITPNEPWKWTTTGEISDAMIEKDMSLYNHLTDFLSIPFDLKQMKRYIWKKYQYEIRMAQMSQEVTVLYDI